MASKTEFARAAVAEALSLESRSGEFTHNWNADRLSCMKAAQPAPEIVVKNGKPISVILSIKRYQELMERLEDAEDLAWLKKARRRKLHYRPLEEVLADLSKS